LLIDRDTKGWFDKFQGKGMSDREQILSCQYPARGAPPLELGSLGEADTLRIVQSIVGPQQSEGTPADTTLRRLRRLDSMARPLYAAFLAATYSRKLDDPGAIIGEILHDEEARWESEGITGDDKRLLTLATICGGIKNPLRMTPSPLDQ